MEITVGMTGSVSTSVEREDTAYEVGSGSLLVYATPCMVALMEGAACEAIAECLSDSQTSVGTGLNIEHISATPVGLEVRAEAEVTAVEGNTITFGIGPAGTGKTYLAMAMAVAAAIDEIGWTEIVGSIAGDDTVMCAIRTVEDVTVVMDKMRKVVL